MQVSFLKDPKDFLEACGAALSRDAALHSLILGHCRRGKGDDTGYAVVSGDDGVALAAALSSRRFLPGSVWHGDATAAAAALADALRAQGSRFAAIAGPSETATVFADIWHNLTGCRYGEYMDQIVYDAREVFLPPAIPGRLRAAEAGEARKIAGWMRRFSDEALPVADRLPDDALKAETDRRIAEGRAYVWDDGGAVATAGISDCGRHWRIGGVYTPEDARGRGYASALVAALTDAQLQAGRGCCLFADARNPVSNSIYRKIGYEFVGRLSHYMLED